MLSRQVEEIGRDFFLRRPRAEAHRREVVRDTDAYRVVHGEADLLPALVVDRYGDYLVMQTLDQGMDAAKAEIVSCLEEIFHPQASWRATTSRCAPRSSCRSRRGARGRGSRVGRGAHERPHPAGRPAARAEDRHLPGPARELPRRRPLRPAARRSIASPRPAASPCTWRANCEPVEAVECPARAFIAASCSASAAGHRNRGGARRDLRNLPALSGCAIFRCANGSPFPCRSDKKEISRCG